MGGRVAHFIVNGRSIRYELGLDRVLYHGTSRRRAEAILREGLKPRVGEFLRSVYPRARLRPLVSAACEVCGSKVFSAARFAVAQELGRDRRTVTREEMLRHSAVVVIESERGNFRQASAMDRPQRGWKSVITTPSSPCGWIGCWREENLRSSTAVCSISARTPIREPE